MTSVLIRDRKKTQADIRNKAMWRWDTDSVMKTLDLKML